MKNCLLKSIIIILLFQSSLISAANVIDIVTYNDYGEHTYITVKQIDLNLKSVIKKIQLPITGEIITKYPLKFDVNNPHRLIISTDGEPCKNCDGINTRSYYAIIDDSLNIIHIDSIPKTGIYDVIFAQNDTLVLLVNEPKDDTSLIIHDVKYYISDSSILQRVGKISPTFNPKATPVVGSYIDLRTVGNNKNNILWDLGDHNDLHLIKIDISNDSILTDKTIGDFLAYSQLLALSEDTNFIYVFSLSYDIPRGGGLLESRNNKPSYVKMYDISNFRQVDSIMIPNIAEDSNYTSNELGLCDKIGQFRVYYFFKSDDGRYFSPAMLFIFDTRTNEARWLRVGWR